MKLEYFAYYNILLYVDGKYKILSSLFRDRSLIRAGVGAEEKMVG
jgi:hypothetical protein